MRKSFSLCLFHLCERRQICRPENPYIARSLPRRDVEIAVYDSRATEVSGMLTRREVLFGAGAATAAAALLNQTVLAKASQPTTPVNFDVPKNACDCHTHIFGDPRRFPYFAGRVYTPESASIAEMNALHRALHTDRVVIVQPTVYGTDNSCTLDAIRQLGPGAADNKVVISPTAPVPRALSRQPAHFYSIQRVDRNGENKRDDPFYSILSPHLAHRDPGRCRF